MKFMRYVNKRIQRKHHKEAKIWISITEPLQMIRMDIFGPVNVMSTSSKDIFLRWLMTTLDRQSCCQNTRKRRYHTWWLINPLISKEYRKTPK